MKSRSRWIGIGAGLIAALVLAGCGDSDDAGGGGDESNNAANNAANNGDNNAANNAAVNNAANNAANNGDNNATANNAVNNDANNAPNNAVNNSAVDPPTYYRDVQPILGRNCLTCHVDGGAGPFPLDTYATASLYGEVAQHAIREGVMPPWKADPECRRFVGERLMTAEEKATFEAWIAAGKPEGDPADARPIDIAPAEIPDPDMVTRSLTPYAPDGSRSDDYRCLVMDAQFPEETLLTGLHLVPDKNELVHHALIYLIPPGGVSSIEAQDAGEPGAGYTCFGSSGGGGELIGVWVPGARPMYFPDGAAYPVAPGSRLVVQIHYNTVAAQSVEDWSSLQLKLTDVASRYRVSMPILLGGVNIPAGDPAATGRGEWQNTTNQEVLLVSVMPHMHLLGRAIDMHVVRADQAAECLVDIKDWDFNWQQFYELPEDDWVRLAPGDRLEWSCTWDNSPGNQPFVNGEQLEPRHVGFGEGTYDEMCVYILTLLVPTTDTAGGSCGDIEGCAAGCDPNDGNCLLACSYIEGFDCTTCLAYGIADCARGPCDAQLNTAVSCLAPCFNEGDFATCIDEGGRCHEQWTDLFTCVGPSIYDGTCNEHFEECGAEF